MRNKRLLAISAIAISASVFMTACSFGGDGKTDKTETVEVTDRRNRYAQLRITRAGKYPDSAWTGRGYDGSNGCP